jgi:hypothetical protein
MGSTGVLGGWVWLMEGFSGLMAFWLLAMELMFFACWLGSFCPLLFRGSFQRQHTRRAGGVRGFLGVAFCCVWLNTPLC